MSSKKIAIVVGEFPVVSQTFIVNQVNALIEKGNDISFYAYRKTKSIEIHDSYSKHNLLDKITYFKKAPKSKIHRLYNLISWTFKNINKINWKCYFKSINFLRYGKEAFSLKLFFESQWFLTSLDFDIIHAHFGMNGNRIAYLKAFEVLPRHLPVIATFHGYDLAPNRLEKYQEEYKYLFKHVSAFTVNTLYLKELLEKVNSFKKPIYILPVGLDINFFKRQLPHKQSKFFDLVFCGKLIALKGAGIGIKVVKKLHELGYNQVRLHIIGHGELKSELNELIDNLELRKYVILYGAITQNEIRQKFNAADVFLFPGIKDPETGRVETQGLVVQEAQAMELPVVTSDVGGIKYGIIPDKSGFVVQEANINEFAHAIEKFILNPELKVKMGKEGRSYVVNQYDSKYLANKLENIYKRIMFTK